MSVSTKRLTREEVSDFIKENGCELLEKEYINNRQKLLIKCKCGNEFKTSFKEFKRMNKRQCNECGKKIAKEKLQQVTYKNYKKSTYETIKNRFKEYGHIMVWDEEEFNEKYENYKTLVKLRCECGNYYYKNIADIKKCVHNKCDVCRSKLKNKDRLKYTPENVQKIIESYGCELISKYSNTQTKIKIKCKCGNVYTTSFYSFINSKHKGCKNCSALEGSKKKRLKIEDVKKIIESDNEYRLLSNDYINNRNKLEILHIKCNKKFKMAFDCFQSGQRCPHCSSSKGEKKIEKWLENNNINFKKQYTFKDLIGLGGGRLRYDFAILNEDNSIKFLIEYDGELHYQPYRKLEKAMEKLHKGQIHDKMKDEYCKNNNIKLIRIIYTDFNNIEKILKALF